MVISLQVINGHTTCVWDFEGISWWDICTRLLVQTLSSSKFSEDMSRGVAVTSLSWTCLKSNTAARSWSSMTVGYLGWPEGHFKSLTQIWQQWNFSATCQLEITNARNTSWTATFSVSMVKDMYQSGSFIWHYIQASCMAELEICKTPRRSQYHDINSSITE